MAKGKIAFIGDADSVLGFKALGVETIVPEGPDEAAEAFRRLVREKTSVIMVTENMLDSISDQIEEASHKPIPSVVVLPDVTGSQHRGEDTIRNLILRAVGVDLMAEED
jgi:V/A-type H+-transporting ATPase subunit F